MRSPRSRRRQRPGLARALQTRAAGTAHARGEGARAMAAGGRGWFRALALGVSFLKCLLIPA